MSRITKNLAVMTFIILASSLIQIGTTHAAESKETLLPIIGDALVEVRDEDYQHLQESLKDYQDQWSSLSISEDKAGIAGRIDEELENAEQLLKQKKQEKLYASVVSLARLTDEFTSSEQSGNIDVSTDDIQGLIGDLEEIQQRINQGNIEKAQTLNKSFVSSWTALEKPIRENNLKAYGAIETKMSMVRVSLNKEPVDNEEANHSVNMLIQVFEDYLDGKTVGATTANQDITLEQLLTVLDESRESANQGDYEQAATKMETFIQSWPTVEGVVSTKDTGVYNQTENAMTEILAILSSEQPDQAKVDDMIVAMKNDLEPFVNQSHYTAWDSFFILFREGMEAILIIATLLAFLRRTGNETERKWVWSGLGIGLIFSAGLAVILTLAFAGLQSGTTREIIEGVTGVVAVLMMMTVGAWLHKQSNILAWNQYINQKLHNVMKKGTKWLLGFVTFIAIFREGAETIIFYLGMAPSIALSQLLLGMAGAICVLLIIGVLLIKFSVRIPIRPFFLIASLLIYYIALKFIGVSIHSLQITDIVPYHSFGNLSSIDVLGFYPTWETLSAQTIVLVVIGLNYLKGQKNKKKLEQKIAS